MQSISETRHSDRLRFLTRILLATFVTLGFLTIAQSIQSIALAVEQLTFATPDAAVDALVAAAAADDMEKLRDIFGPEYEEDLIGGDEIAFRETLKTLARALAEGASLRDGDSDTKTLIVGAKEWPFPFPIVRQAGVWHFDTAAGVEEVVDRRIGRNELSAIEICRAYVDAQAEYARTDHDGDAVREFAQKILSEEGQKDGLYWETGDDGKISPFGPLVADARNYLEGH